MMSVITCEGTYKHEEYARSYNSPTKMALPNFPIDKAYLIGDWLAAVLWGAFTTLFILWVVSTIKLKRARSPFAIFSVCALWVLATSHISLALARLIQAFIVHVDDPDGGAIAYLADIGRPLNRSKDMIYISIIFFADTVIIWRCFMVWNKNYYIIILPSIMAIATAISGYGAVGRYFLPNPFTPTSVKWAEAMLAVSMVTNILVTILTAGKIWKIAHDSTKLFGAGNNRYNYILLLIIESGVIMAVSKTIEFVLFLLAPDDGLDGLNALYIPLECMPQIMGICPTFIMLSVNAGLNTFDSGAYTTTRVQSRKQAEFSVNSGNGSTGMHRIAPLVLVGKETIFQGDSKKSESATWVETNSQDTSERHPSSNTQVPNAEV